MGGLPAVLLLCSFHALAAVAQDQQAVTTPGPAGTLPANCREEMYPCTRMYSVHRPIKQCVSALCFYSLPRVYVINKEICLRTVCEQDEYRKAELCRELSGWPRRAQRSTVGKRCGKLRSNLRSNPRSNRKTWANMA